MTSTIGWLDASAAEQRRVQEIVRMFSQSETVDELGGRQAFVAVADELFPGTSVLHSRARYLIFIPWLCRRAAANPNPRVRLDRLERTLIGKFLEDDTVDAADRLTGLIGREAGPYPPFAPVGAGECPTGSFEPGDLRRATWPT